MYMISIQPTVFRDNGKERVCAVLQGKDVFM